MLKYAFVPGDQPWNEALLLTDSVIIRRTPRGARRHSLDDIEVKVYYNGTSRGLVITDSKSGVPDTLYRTLSGAELGALTSAMKAVASPARAKESSPPAAPSPRP